MHGGDLIAGVLAAQGVPFLFTLCGGHISPILVGCKQRGIRVIDTRHEATAVFAADATARLSGRPGVAAVTAGPGLTNTITAVKNAQIAQSPIVLLGGAAPTVLKGRGALQDIDQMALLRPHVKWARAVRRVAAMPAHADYVVWESPTRVLTAAGTRVYRLNLAAGADARWTLVADFREEGMRNLSRLALSPDGQWLALVTETP